VIEDPELVGIEVEQCNQLSSILDLPKLSVIPKSYREQIKVLVEGLLKELEMFPLDDNDIIQDEDEKGTRVINMRRNAILRTLLFCLWKSGKGILIPNSVPDGAIIGIKKSSGSYGRVCPA
jgi:hypothetical protein